MTAPLECAYLPPDTASTLASPSMPVDGVVAWIETHGCHAAATWAILTPGARPADATYACHQHLAELCEDGATVWRVVDGEVWR